MSAPPVDTEVQPGTVVRLRAPLNNDELDLYVQALWGLRLGRERVCEHHDAPFDAFAASYFARYDPVVIKGSRGLAGKTFQLAHLGLTMEVALGAEVHVLGGSGSQAENCLRYMDQAWRRDSAPKGLLIGDPAKRKHGLTNGGSMTALAASTKSARSPHGQRLLCDEVDEMDLTVFDAAMGIPMSKHGVTSQTTITSTKQYATGTMSTIEQRLRAGQYPKGRYFTWCFRESMAAGWLTREQIESKRATVTNAMWQIEYELEDLSPTDMLIYPETLEVLFGRTLQDEEAGRPFEREGGIGEEIIVEEPEEGGWYATGADWAKENDFTCVATIRWDCRPARVVAFRRDGRRPWPAMVSAVDRRVAKYPPRPGFYPGCHDATGIGNVVEDYMESECDPVVMVGKVREQMFSDYVQAIEHEEIRWPMIRWAYDEHRYATQNDIRGSGHPPDSVVAGALAWRATMRRRRGGTLNRALVWG